MTITRVAPMSVARIAGVLYALMGLLLGLLFSTASMLGGFGPGAGAPGAFGAMMGASAVFVLPIVYGFFGFVMTLIGAAMYNALAAALGGIEIETR